MFWDHNKMTKEQLTLHEKAEGDAEAIEVLMYSMLRFLADIKSSPDTISKATEALKAVKALHQEIGYKIHYAKEAEKH